MGKIVHFGASREIRFFRLKNHMKSHAGISRNRNRNSREEVHERSMIAIGTHTGPCDLHACSDLESWIATLCGKNAPSISD